MDIIATRTGKDVALQLDVGTCLEAGADPVAWIDRTRAASRASTARTGRPGAATRCCSAKALRHGSASSRRQNQEVVSSITWSSRKRVRPREQLQRAERCLANWKKLKP
jgi:hypothetical protein